MTSSTRQPAAPAGGTAPAYEPPRLSHRQIMTVLSGLLLGMFLAALDQNIVSVAIVKIANDLNGFSEQAWATTAYLITATIATPLYGKLSDIYGRKPFYLTAIALFVIGSAACTFATSMYELAAFRAFQGLGAGGLMSLAMTIIGDIVPPRERVRYQGYFMMVFGSATVLGPVLGGFFSGFDTLGGLHGWRWVFLINVPIGIAALFVVAKVLNIPHRRQPQRIDWFGALALAVAVVPLLLVAEQGRTWGWGSTTSVICYAVAAFGVVLFIFVEYVMKDAALIPLRLFKNSTFSVVILGGTIVGIAMFGGITMVPQYFQVVRGYSPTEAGLLMLPLVLGIMTGSQISGRVTAKTGRYKFLPIVGTAVIALGAVLYAQVHFDSPLWQPLAYALVIGLGLGGCMQTLIIAAQNAGPRKDMGVSTASATFFRQMGGTLGVAVFLTILFNLLPSRIADAFGGKLPPQFDASQLTQLQSNTAGLQNLPPALKDPILTGFTNSMHGVFYVAAAFAVLACIVLLFMREIPLSSGGPAAAPAAPVEGGEALLNDSAAQAPAAAAMEADTWIDANAALDAQDREPVLVGGRHSAPGETNGHGRYELAAQTAPFATATAGMSSSIDTDGQPISGHIRRQDGSSVLGAALTLIDQRGRQVARGTAGGDGGYTINAPGAGTYVLIVSAGGHQPQASSVVVGQGPARLDLTLIGSGELSGVVRVAGRGTPFPGATVTLTDSRGEVTGASITTAEGVYTFHGVGAGVYTLVASAERMRPVAEMLTVPDSGVLRHDLELSSAVVLAGTARTDGDRVVPDARITVLDTDGNVAAVARTDAEGKYVVSDLPEGDYTVVASGYPPATSQVNLLGGEATHDVRLGYEQVIDEFGGEQA
ncbi:MFS transporter [Amycolatopsis acidiphila]|uniref:MFS transporter n=1 Tax=Amycolatopsis acidiphila TaxID=715473 RepID=A0A558AGS9_9PSEU|nr:MFS transporter [Amycolatopsis acidiphila]TVT23485.1 MFS transporter [Amycolatopsis acidiphila]UIJ59944.1 MFS transporter [Amycolatopsis acidiphila]GHG62286.1 MFS transporter [Amycolatopsis acidiphila]